MYFSDNKGPLTKMNEVQDIYALQHSYLVLVDFLRFSQLSWEELQMRVSIYLFQLDFECASLFRR